MLLPSAARQTHRLTDRQPGSKEQVLPVTLPHWLCRQAGRQLYVAFNSITEAWNLQPDTAHERKGWMYMELSFSWVYLPLARSELHLWGSILHKFVFWHPYELRCVLGS